MENLILDDDISNWLLNQTNIFKNIHPNMITGFGFILNYHLYKELQNPFIDKQRLISILFLRWLADCLDGNVARKYKKTSKLGNQLDTLSDLIFGLIIFDYVYKHTRNQSYKVILIILLIVLLKYTFIDNNLLDNHSEIKSKNNTLFQKINTFRINNSFVIFILFYFYINNQNVHSYNIYG